MYCTAWQDLAGRARVQVFFLAVVGVLQAVGLISTQQPLRMHGATFVVSIEMIQQCDNAHAVALRMMGRGGRG